MSWSCWSCSRCTLNVCDPWTHQVTRLLSGGPRDCAVTMCHLGMPPLGGSKVSGKRRVFNGVFLKRPMNAHFFAIYFFHVYQVHFFQFCHIFGPYYMSHLENAKQHQLIGLREQVQENPIFHGKSMVSFRFSLKSTHWKHGSVANLQWILEEKHQAAASVASASAAASRCGGWCGETIKEFMSISTA